MSIQGDGTWDTISWPYPQIRETDYYIIGLSVDSGDLKVYELVNENNTWTATEIYNLGDVDDISFVDVESWGQFYVVTASKIISDDLSVTSFIRNPNGTTTALPTTTVPVFSAICNFNGQAIITGINSSTTPWNALGWSSVAWSGIGNFNFAPNESGNKTAGFGHIPTYGEGKGLAHRVKKLGDIAIVYSDQCIVPLTPHDIGRTGYAIGDRLFCPGIPTPNHIAGDDNIHFFIDTDSELWQFKKGSQPENLGYKEFLSTLTENEVRMTYVSSKRRLYISDSTSSFTLTEYGLYTSHQCVTSALDYRGNILCGFYSDNQDREARLTTDTIDFGARGLKSTESIQAAISCDETVYASLQYKYSYKDPFSNFNWVEINKEGVATMWVTASEFRFRLKCDDYEGSNFNLSRLDIRVKQVDKRYIRGLSNASSSFARPNS